MRPQILFLALLTQFKTNYLQVDTQRVQKFGVGPSAIIFGDSPSYQYHNHYSDNNNYFGNPFSQIIVRRDNSQRDNSHSSSRRRSGNGGGQIRFENNANHQIVNENPTINFGSSPSIVNHQNQRPQPQGINPTGFENPRTNGGNGGGCTNQHDICQHYSQCSLYMPEYLENRLKQKTKLLFSNTCQLPGGGLGVCCREIIKNIAETPSNSIGNRIKEHENSIQNRFGPTILNNQALEDTLLRTQDFFTSYDSAEKQLLKRNLAIKRGTSSYGHLLFFQTSKKAIELSRLGLNLLQMTKDLRSSFVNTRIFSDNRNNDQNSINVGVGLKNYNLGATSIGGQCPGPIKCDERYIHRRSIDGSCNNLNRPSLGATFTPLMRLVTPHYADGVWSPRSSVSRNVPLTSPRLLSSVFNQDVDTPNTHYTLWVMQFGQFIDHDLSHVPNFRYNNGSGIECCSSDGNFLPVTLTHPHCLAIEIPHNDGFYRPYRQRCMNFVRSMVGPRSDCSLGYADQLNQITHYLDGSNIYGSTPEDQQELREFKDGRLKTDRFFHNHKGMLPIQTNDHGDECTEPDKGIFCFNAGDLRVNEMIGLTTTHLIWLREHNRIAQILQQLNRHWTDEDIFQETRRIVNAEYQHIIYNEWLPIIVGRKYMETYGILPQAKGYFQGYNPSINPGVSNAFAAAAFRMGHTLIQGLLPLVNNAGQLEDELIIHEHFNKPFRIRESRMVDKLLRTLTTTPIQSFDRFITSEVTNRLFQEEEKPFGMDLISLNIQRGRDHGLPGYNTFRELCQLGKAVDFQHFADWISSDAIGKLRKYYEHVDDVDLFIGGILEKPLAGAILGPTFTCIIGDQFSRSRKADRFIYDGGPSPSSFSSEQLNQIRRVSFSRILCDNGDQLSTIQPYAFLMPEPSYNPQMDCKSHSIHTLDLSHWRYQ